MVESGSVGRILVVDDEPDIVRLVKFTLERRGFEVLVAYEGRGGIEQAVSEQPDLILLDVMMPEMTGYEACQRLRENPKTKNIPVVILSAKSQEAEIRQALACGADSFISKPFTPSELGRHVVQILEETKERGGDGGKKDTDSG